MQCMHAAIGNTRKNETTGHIHVCTCAGCMFILWIMKNKLKLSTDAPATESAEAPAFVKNLQGPTLADRAAELKQRESGGSVIVNNNTANTVSSGGTTVQNHATRYVRDQSSVFASNNA